MDNRETFVQNDVTIRYCQMIDKIQIKLMNISRMRMSEFYANQNAVWA